MKTAVFLDRDRTVIELFDHPVDPTEVKLIDVARQTVTNHSVVGREQHPRPGSRSGRSVTVGS